MGRSRKMKRNRKTRKNRKRGGHYVHYDHNKPRGYPYQGRSLAVHPGDCVASVFYFLGFSNYEDSIHLAKTFPHGLEASDIKNILDLAYQPYSHRWEQFTHYSQLRDLPYGYATMAIFDFDKDTAHAVVIYRHSDGIIYINDPQQNNGLMSGQVHEYFGNIYRLSGLGMGPDGTMHQISILRSDIPVHMSTDNRVHKGVIDYYAMHYELNPNGSNILPPPGMGHYPHEQAEAREQARDIMALEAQGWGEMDNSNLFPKSGPRQSPAWLQANRSRVLSQYAP
jgi:hypothetical protein